MTAAAGRTTYAGPAGSPRSSAVMVAGLRKSYGAVQAVRGTSFAVSRGEIFALLEPNGAGKTTTLEILEGFRDLGVLAWGAAGTLIAVRRFRWDPRPE